MSLVIRPATKADIEAYYGTLPPQTIRAWVGEKDGKMMGIGGYSLAKGAVIVFTDHRPEISKRDIVRGARFLMRIYRDLKMEVLAIPPPEGEGKSAMAHYGFVPHAGYNWRLAR